MGTRVDDWWDYVLEPDNSSEDDIAIEEVEPGTSKAATDGVLRSGGLDRCLAVGAYSHDSERGYMTHIAGFREDPSYVLEQLSGFVMMVKSETEDENVDFFAGGLSENTELEGDQYGSAQSALDVFNIGAQRAGVENYLENNTSSHNFEWGSDDDYYSELVVDLVGNPSFIYNPRAHES
jgi:hypothetical protein